MNFATAITALKEALDDKEATRTLLRGLLTKLESARDVKIHELQETLSRVQGDLAQTARRLAEAEGELRAVGHVEQLWRSMDGERLIALAYKADPRAATVALNNLGGYLIAQELRDRGLMKARELPGTVPGTEATV